MAGRGRKGWTKMTASKKKKRKRDLRLVALCTVFVVSGVLLARELIRAGREKEVNQSLIDQVHQAREEVKAAQNAAPSPPAAASEPLLNGDPPAQPSQGGEEPPEPVASVKPEPVYAKSGILLQYDALWQQNNDMAGWLWIEGTDIEYPVMYTPEEPERYLHTDFYGSYAAGGCLFLGEGGGPDAAHVIVFGHHMKNGTMFGSLRKYSSAEYAAEHPIIHLDTLTEEREYEVVTAFYSRVYDADDVGAFRYYQYTDLSNRQKFSDYVSRMWRSALYNTGVEVEYGQRLLVLSTCSYHTDNGRFAVVAREKTD